MYNNLKIEFKKKITKDEYERLINLFNLKDKIFIQTNYYFDTPDFLLQKNKLMFRVRYDGVYYEGTLKLPNGNEEKIEINETVSQEEFINLCAGRGIYEGAVQSKLKELGYNIGGFCVVSDSTVPKGAGVSSSAAFEVLVAKIVSYYYNNDSTLEKIA